MATQTDYAQLAAYIDGEGSIYVKPVYNQSGKEYTQLVVSVTNTDPRLSNWCKSRFGGATHRNSHMSKGQKNHACDWRVHSAAAEKILRNCMPYFIIKREQAEIALLYRSTFPGKRGREVPLTEGALMVRRSAAAELKRLKTELPTIN